MRLVLALALASALSVATTSCSAKAFAQGAPSNASSSAIVNPGPVTIGSVTHSPYNGAGELDLNSTAPQINFYRPDFNPGQKLWQMLLSGTAAHPVGEVWNVGNDDGTGIQTLCQFESFSGVPNFTCQGSLRSGPVSGTYVDVSTNLISFNNGAGASQTKYWWLQRTSDTTLDLRNVQDDQAGAVTMVRFTRNGTAAVSTAFAGVIQSNLQSLPTCSATLEGSIQSDSLSGVATGAVTRICMCASNGASVYTWMNIRTGTNGTATTCAP